MSEAFKPLVDSAVGIIGLGSVIVGIIAYNRAQVTKRADVLFPLIKEFDESKSMDYAKKIMDDHPVAVNDPSLEFNPNWIKGLVEEKEPPYWNKDDLTLVLRDHRNTEEGVITNEEDEIRRSFDSLLDFFCKLEYLLEIHQVTKREIEIFNYYIDKVAEDNAILNYIKKYNFPLHGRLHERLNIDD
jgi:hypothetical protein